MNWFDQAVLRRFDLKIPLNDLSSEQAETLFSRVPTDPQGYTGLRRYAESVKMRLSKFSSLTLGDFAAVLRQTRMLGTRYDAEQLLGALEAEYRAKASMGKQVRAVHS